MSRRFGLLALVAVSLSVAGMGCTWGGPRVWIEDTQEMTIPAADLARLEVTTHNGPVYTKGRSGAKDLSVTVTRRAGGWSEDDARACLEAIHLISERSGPDAHRLAWKWGSVRHVHWQASVRYDITMPNRLELKGTTHNGRIEAVGLAAPSEITTHNGRVKIESSAGEVKATSHNGGIEAATAGPRVALKTHNGRIRAAVAGEDVRIRTHNGGIEADLTACGEVGGRIDTYNGEVKLALGEKTAADFTCRTHNGRITTDVPLMVTEASKHCIRGRLRDGSAKLAVETHNGSIRLTRAAD